MCMKFIQVNSTNRQQRPDGFVCFRLIMHPTKFRMCQFWCALDFANRKFWKNSCYARGSWPSSCAVHHLFSLLVSACQSTDREHLLRRVARQPIPSALFSGFTVFPSDLFLFPVFFRSRATGVKPPSREANASNDGGHAGRYDVVFSSPDSLLPGEGNRNRTEVGSFFLQLSHFSRLSPCSRCLIMLVLFFYFYFLLILNPRPSLNICIFPATLCVCTCAPCYFYFSSKLVIFTAGEVHLNSIAPPVASVREFHAANGVLRRG